MNIIEIEKFKDSLTGKEEEIVINKSEKVPNPKQTLNTFINYLKGNKKNQRFNPYYFKCIEIVRKTKQNSIKSKQKYIFAYIKIEENVRRRI